MKQSQRITLAVIAVVIVSVILGFLMYGPLSSKKTVTVPVAPSTPAPVVQPPPPSAASPAEPAPAAPATAAPAPPPIALPADCVMPGPVPALPRGAVATIDDMKVAHTAIQGFVKALEAYQACLEQHIASAPPTTTSDEKQVWRRAGNNAIDIANLLAKAYDAQYKIFKAQQPAPAPAAAPK